jgi:hypothetical protein
MKCNGKKRTQIKSQSKKANFYLSSITIMQGKALILTRKKRRRSLKQ